MIMGFFYRWRIALVWGTERGRRATGRVYVANWPSAIIFESQTGRAQGVRFDSILKQSLGTIAAAV